MKAPARICVAISEVEIQEIQEGKNAYTNGLIDGLKHTLIMLVGKEKADELLLMHCRDVVAADIAEDTEENGWIIVDATGPDEDGFQYARAIYVEDRKVAGEQVFHHSQAWEDAASFVAAADEVAEYSMEERLGPYGIEWQREQEERRGW